MSVPSVPFESLSGVDLYLDRIYCGGSAGNAGDDPLAALLPVGNQGGIRVNGSIRKQTVKVVALYTTLADHDWPDAINPETGDFTYYGDNKRPGSGLHETARGGNELLRLMFELAHGSPDDRRRVPPVLLFEKSGEGRNITFRGLLAPGSNRLNEEEELVAVWRTTRKHRFQNYRAHFTILRTPTVTRTWIDEILAGEPLGPSCPAAWRRWVQARLYDALEAPRTLAVRSKEDQYPDDEGMAMLRDVHEYFAPQPVAFEHLAADLWLHSDPHVEAIDVTRPSRDGGRDAIGTYLLGPETDPVRINFALEAKCYEPGKGVGVREISRLVSRIRHRDFGVMVTTSHIGQQAYEEVRGDQHPIIFMTGRDIVDALHARGVTNRAQLASLLSGAYPLADSDQSATVQADLQIPEVEVTFEVDHPAEGFPQGVAESQ